MAQTLEQRRHLFQFTGYIGLYACGFGAYALADLKAGFLFNLICTGIIGALIRVCIELASKGATRTIYAEAPEPPDLALIWEQGQQAGWYDNVARTANPRAPLARNPYTQER